jgi:hypothetical protein
MTTHTNPVMTLEETKEGLERLARFFGADDYSDRDLMLSALHHLEAGKRDVENLPTIDLERAVRVAAENLAKDSTHIPHIQKVIEDAFEQARQEAIVPLGESHQQSKLGAPATSPSGWPLSGTLSPQPSQQERQ